MDYSAYNSVYRLLIRFMARKSWFFSLLTGLTPHDARRWRATTFACHGGQQRGRGVHLITARLLRLLPHLPRSSTTARATHHGARYASRYGQSRAIRISRCSIRDSRDLYRRPLQYVKVGKIIFFPLSLHFTYYPYIILHLSLYYIFLVCKKPCYFYVQMHLDTHCSVQVFWIIE